ARRRQDGRGISAQGGAVALAMSLNKTLDRLFDEIRREAKRNPEFADRLDGVLRGHASRRDVADDVIAEVNAEPEPAPTSAKQSKKAAPPPEPEPIAAAEAAPTFNPVGLYQR